MPVCMYVWMDGWMDGWMHGCMDAWMLYVCMYVRMDLWMYLRTWVPYVSSCDKIVANTGIFMCKKSKHEIFQTSPS